MHKHLSSFLHLDHIAFGSQCCGDELYIVSSLPRHSLHLISRQDRGQDQSHLHHGKVLAHTVPCPRGERIKSKFLDGREGRFTLG